MYKLNIFLDWSGNINYTAVVDDDNKNKTHSVTWFPSWTVHASHSTISHSWFRLVQPLNETIFSVVPYPRWKASCKIHINNVVKQIASWVKQKVSIKDLWWSVPFTELLTHYSQTCPKRTPEGLAKSGRYEKGCPLANLLLHRNTLTCIQHVPHRHTPWCKHRHMLLQRHTYTHKHMSKQLLFIEGGRYSLLVFF